LVTVAALMGEDADDVHDAPVDDITCNVVGSPRTNPCRVAFEGSAVYEHPSDAHADAPAATNALNAIYEA
jgi:hypothetical protein